MIRSILIFSLLLSASTLSAQQVNRSFNEQGQFLKFQLSSAPFPHSRRASGHVYGKQLYPAEKHYSDSSVAVFIPKGFRSTEAVDFVVHIHGWWNNIDTVFSRYRLAQQLVESGKNAILVVPEGPRNAPDSFGGKFEDPGGFKRFIDDVALVLFRNGTITTHTVGKVVLSGHSGAYQGISFTLMQGGMPEKIREVYLFDALYGQTEKFAHWIDHYDGKLVVLYTDSGGTKDETEGLMEDLRAWNIPYFAADETALSQSDLSRHRLLFIHTDLKHNMVMHYRMQLRSYLKASCLLDR
jgi:hypothetical protein